MRSLLFSMILIFGFSLICSGENITLYLQIPDVPPISEFIVYGVRMVNVAISSVNDRYEKHFLHLQTINYENNNTLAGENIRTLIQDPDMLVYLGSVSPDHSDFLLEEVAAADAYDLAIIAPMDTKDRLRRRGTCDDLQNPDLVNWFHMLASTTEEMAASVEFITSNLGLSRIAAIDQGLELSGALNASLESVGRRLIKYVRREGFGAATQEELQSLIDSKPQAIILELVGEDLIPFLVSAKNTPELNDTVFILPGLSTSVSGIEFALLTEGPYIAENVYAVTSTPSFADTSNSLVQRMLQDIATYDPTVLTEGASVGYSPATADLNIYKGILWFAQVMDSIPEDNVTRQSIVDSIYEKNAFIKIEGESIGPFILDCKENEQDKLYSSCNQGARNVYIQRLVDRTPIPGAWETIETYSWSGCSALTEDIKIPILTGSTQISSSLNDAVKAGISLGVKNSVEKELIENALFLFYESDETFSQQLATELVEIDGVVSMIGITNPEDALWIAESLNILVWTISPDKSLRIGGQHYNPNIFALFPNIDDQVYTCFDYASTINENFQNVASVSPSGAIDSAVEFWANEFNVQRVSSNSDPNLAIVYDDSVDLENIGADIICVIGTYEPVSQIQNNIVFVLPVPPPSIYNTSSSVPSEHNTLLNDYYGQISSLSKRGVSNGTSEETIAEYLGYITGRFAMRLLSSINGAVTTERVIETIYDLSIISEGGLTTGIINSECNQGLQKLYVSNNDLSSIVHSTEWNTCGAEAQVSDVNKGDGDDQMDVIIGSVVGLASMLIIILCIIICIIIVCLVIILGSVVSTGGFLHKFSGNKKKIVRLVEPDYEKLAFSDEYTDGEKVDTELKYGQTYVAREKVLSEHLDLFEEFIMELNYAIPTILALKEAVSDNKKLASWILYMYHHKHREFDLLRYIISDEIKECSDISVLFRSDSFLTRMFKSYCFLEGLHYLWKTLAKPMLTLNYLAIGKEGVRIQQDTTHTLEQSGPSYDTTDVESVQTLKTNDTMFSYLEIDPKKTDSNSVHQVLAALTLLQHQAQVIFNSMTKPEFPNNISRFCKLVVEAVLEKYGDEKEITISMLRTYVSSFVFLRFICPAITGPQFHGIMPETPVAQSLRVFILLSKVMQNLANGVEFTKEEYMTKMNSFIRNNIEIRDKFLDSIIFYERDEKDYEKSEKENQCIKDLLDQYQQQNETFYHSEDEMYEKQTEQGYKRITVSHAIYNVSKKYLFLTFLENSERVVQTLFKHLNKEQMEACYYDYLKPLGICNECPEPEPSVEIIYSTESNSSEDSDELSDEESEIEKKIDLNLVKQKIERERTKKRKKKKKKVKNDQPPPRRRKRKNKGNISVRSTTSDSSQDK